MILIANWKMQLGLAESEAAAQAIKAGLASNPGSEVVIAPSFPAIAAVGKILGHSGINLGAQDCFWQNKGPFTGEVSAMSLKELGCRYVIVGHSERRAMGDLHGNFRGFRAAVFIDEAHKIAFFPGRQAGGAESKFVRRAALHAVPVVEHVKTAVGASCMVEPQ